MASELHEGTVRTTSQVQRDRLERIATAVLSGFAASGGQGAETGLHDTAAQDAVWWAYALIAELDK